MSSCCVPPSGALGDRSEGSGQNSPVVGSERDWSSPELDCLHWVPASFHSEENF